MKHPIINDIIDLMEQNGVSPRDIVIAMSDRRRRSMDLLCEINGEKVRLPFEEGKNEKVIGIFPFSSKTYLCVEETTETTRKGADEASIPTFNFFKELYVVVDELNDILTKLNLPIVEGVYFAEPTKTMYDPYWIIGIDERGFTSDYYGSDATAKIRYCGIFE